MAQPLSGQEFCWDFLTMLHAPRHLLKAQPLSGQEFCWDLSW